ncbi:hypothetical protein HAX54_021790 [Datura stramonium]|uniref:Uncharacterized protein n=1 Tax=Datura stramonium TaxID=4076 RepID=A0ABS8UT95_DATST|nr:hypothetical protein [Datura stramonium]
MKILVTLQGVMTNLFMAADLPKGSSEALSHGVQDTPTKTQTIVFYAPKQGAKSSTTTVGEASALDLPKGSSEALSHGVQDTPTKTQTIVFYAPKQGAKSSTTTVGEASALAGASRGERVTADRDELRKVKVAFLQDWQRLQIIHDTWVMWKRILEEVKVGSIDIEDQLAKARSLVEL